MARWWVQQGVEMVGPYEDDEARGHYGAGAIGPSAMVCREGAEAWISAAEAFGPVRQGLPAPLASIPQAQPAPHPHYANGPASSAAPHWEAESRARREAATKSRRKRDGIIAAVIGVLFAIGITKMVISGAASTPAAVAEVPRATATTPPPPVQPEPPPKPRAPAPLRLLHEPSLDVVRPRALRPLRCHARHG